MAEYLLGFTGDGKKIVLVTFSGPSSYSSGGFSVTVSSLNDIYEVIFIKSGGTPANGYTYEYEDTGDYTKVTNVIGPIKVYEQSVTATSPSYAEVAAGTDLSGLSFKAIIIGV